MTTTINWRPTMDHDYARWMAECFASERDASALALNMLTGDIEASLDLILPLNEGERIAVISSLASDLSIALRKVHGSTEAAIDHLRTRLHYLAERS